MKYIFVTFLVPFWLGTMVNLGIAGESKLQSSLQHNRSENVIDTTARGFVQEQINLIARIENSLMQPDVNRVRAVRGQIIVQAKAIEGFVRRQDPSFKDTCRNASSNGNNLRSSQAQIYCYLYASSQELLKLSPLMDRILSRRGELALVGELPLVSGERQSDPVLAFSPIKRPNLAQKATPFAIQEPNLPRPTPPIVGRVAKRTLVNYRQPMQSALVFPQEAIPILETAEKFISQAKIGFSQSTKFSNPRETAAALDRFAYDIDPQEAQTYQSVLALPKTGIFRVLPYSAYRRPLNTLHNRLLKTVSDRYPFPSWGETKAGFTPNLALMLAEDSFQILPNGIDYNFMVDLGNIPIEKLDTTLKTATPEIREKFLNYEPPRQLATLQSEYRRFRISNSPISSVIPARLNHTYLVRIFQFKLSQAIINGKVLSPQERLQIDELLKYQSSDTIVAFRPVRQRSDGSYTVVWRVLNQLNAPQINDLEAYLKY